MKFSVLSSIRARLLCVTLAISSLLLVAVGFDANNSRIGFNQVLDAIDANTALNDFNDFARNRRNEHLLSIAAALAIEIDPTSLGTARQQGDLAATRVRQAVSKPLEAGKASDLWPKSATLLSEFRLRVDGWLNDPDHELDIDAAADTFNIFTGLLDGAKPIRDKFEHNVSSQQEPSIQNASRLREELERLAELNAREAGLLLPFLAEEEAMVPQSLAQMSIYRGGVEAAWDQVARLLENVPAEPQRAVEAVADSFFQDFEALRKEIYQAGILWEDFPIDGRGWLTRNLNEFATIDRATASAIGLVEERLTQTAEQERQRLIVSVALGGIAIGLTAIAIFILSNGVAAPIGEITRAMGKLAAGQLDVTIKPYNPRSEVGRMATALQQFVANAHEVEALRRKSTEDSKRATTHRLAMLREIADRIEQRVGEFTSQLESSAGTLDRHALSLTSIIGTGLADGIPSDNESAHSRSVSKATVHLAGTMHSISELVRSSSDKAESSTSQASGTRHELSELLDAIGKVGKQIASIGDIAEQTNLLALNATIEAARAGDAGRGFAVVASEVKSLADLTGNLTGDIAESMTAVNSTAERAIGSTGDIIEAIERIGTMLRQINDAVEDRGGLDSDDRTSVWTTIGDVEDSAKNAAELSQRVQLTAGDINKTAVSLEEAVSALVGDLRNAS